MTHHRRQTHRVRPALGWLLAPAILMLAVADSASAQVERKGFIIGFGLGAARVTTSVSEGSITVSLNETAVSTDFKIGYAPNDQLLIYWSSDVAFRSPPSELDSDGIFFSGLGGIGATYFLDPGENSFLLTASIGRAVDGEIGTDGSSGSTSGTGLAIGGGYEFTGHWLVDVDLVFNRFEEFGIDINQRILRLGLSWLHY